MIGVDFNKAAEVIYKEAVKKGFWDGERNFGESLMLVVSELGDAVEAHRNSRHADKSAVKEEDFINSFKEHAKDTIEDEIADAIIRLLDLCGGLGIDINWHIENKFRYNQSRERLHGKAY